MGVVSILGVVPQECKVFDQIRNIKSLKNVEYNFCAVEDLLSVLGSK